MRTLFATTLAQLKSPVYQDALASMGLVPEDLRLLRVKRLWSGIGEKNRVRQILLAVTHACMEANSIPRGRLPAEAVATTICTFVDPANFAPAAYLFHGSVYRLRDLTRAAWDNLSHFQWEQLYAMCLEIHEYSYAGVSAMAPTLNRLEAYLRQAALPDSQATPSTTILPPRSNV